MQNHTLEQAYLHFFEKAGSTLLEQKISSVKSAEQRQSNINNQDRST